jgi:hypothetical protein
LSTLAQRNGSRFVSLHGTPVATVPPKPEGQDPHTNNELLLEELKLEELDEDGHTQSVFAKDTKSPVSPVIFALLPNIDQLDPEQRESRWIANFLSFASSVASILESANQVF